MFLLENSKYITRSHFSKDVEEVIQCYFRFPMDIKICTPSPAGGFPQLHHQEYLHYPHCPQLMTLTPHTPVQVCTGCQNKTVSSMLVALNRLVNVWRALTQSIIGQV